MGLIMDTLEDNAERYGQFLYSISGVSEPSLGPEPPPIETINCPACDAFFSSEAKLQDHIFDIHRSVRFYVKVNNHVIQEMLYLDDIPETLTVTAMETDCSVTLNLRGESQSIYLKAGRATDLSAKIPNDYRGQIVLTVRIGTAYEREYRIFCHEMPNMDFIALDALVRHLQQPLLEDLEPDWSLFRSTYIQGIGSNPLETRYLSGFYEYLLGSFLEKNNDQAARVHYEQAFGYLRPFKTHLAYTACSILALKMNWFWMLKRCKVNSKFYLPNIFFNHSLWDNEPFTAAPSATVATPDGLWIDSFQETLLEALQRYYVRDLQGVMTISTQLKNHSFIRDRNNADKVALLEARSLLMQGNRVAAVGVYRQLRYHPLFGHEVEEVIA